jgi:hypothetical protein
MRISTDPGDIGYRLWNALSKQQVALVYCNGEALTDCVMVDTKRRIALVAARDGTGNLAVNARGDRVRLRQVVGDMRIEIVRRA